LTFLQFFVGVLGLTPSQLAVFGGITLAASLGINQLLKNQTKTKKSNGTSDTNNKEESKEAEDDFAPPRLARKNTVDLDREGKSFSSKKF